MTTTPIALGSGACASSWQWLATADIPEFGSLWTLGLNPKTEPCSALTWIRVGAAQWRIRSSLAGMIWVSSLTTKLQWVRHLKVSTTSLLFYCPKVPWHWLRISMRIYLCSPGLFDLTFSVICFEIAWSWVTAPPWPGLTCLGCFKLFGTKKNFLSNKAIKKPRSPSSTNVSFLVDTGFLDLGGGSLISFSAIQWGGILKVMWQVEEQTKIL